MAANVKSYSKHTALCYTAVSGGIDMKSQSLVIKGGVEMPIATPGLLLDHIEAKSAVLNQVEYVVLDAADRMLDFGFLSDLQCILSYLQGPALVEVVRPSAKGTYVDQRFCRVADDDKRAVIRPFLLTRKLMRSLARDGPKKQAFYGDRCQDQWLKPFSAFKAGVVRAGLAHERVLCARLPD